jgi:nifR3 family TIM-barrel protein
MPEKLPGQFFFAPLAELSTVPLRRCVRSFSKDAVLFSEMLSANLVLHGGKHNKTMMARTPGDDPFIWQILGRDPGMMAEAASLLEENSSGIDINMGCSAPEILLAGVGSSLLREEALARSIIRACRAAVKGSLSVKIRAGFDDVDRDFTLRFCSMIADEGADWVVIHPRAAKHAFRRSADWSVIRHVKEHVNIPVVGNGDIRDASDAVGKLKSGVCDGVMIARRAVQEPWIFSRCSSIMNDTGSSGQADLLQSGLSVLRGIETELPPEMHRSRAHRFLFYFCKNFIFGHELFSKIRNTEDLSVMAQALEGYCERNPGERFRSL